MPPFTPRPSRMYGQLTAVEDVQGNFGPQVRVIIKQANPEAMADRMLFFPASDSTKGKWMKFIASMERFVGKITSEAQMLGRWVEITENPFTFTDKEGETREGVNPLVTAVYNNEAECRAAWQASQAASGLPMAAPAPASTPTAPVTIDPAVVPMLKMMYANSGGNDQAFLKAAEGMGFKDPDAVLKAVKA